MSPRFRDIHGSAAWPNTLLRYLSGVRRLQVASQTVEVASQPRLIVRCCNMRYWHSFKAAGYVEVPLCPLCFERHPIVALYQDDEHIQLAPEGDLFRGATLPCGAVVDLVYDTEVCDGQ